MNLPARWRSKRAVWRAASHATSRRVPISAASRIMSCWFRSI